MRAIISLSVAVSVLATFSAMVVADNTQLNGVIKELQAQDRKNAAEIRRLNKDAHFAEKRHMEADFNCTIDLIKAGISE